MARRCVNMRELLSELKSDIDQGGKSLAIATAAYLYGSTKRNLYENMSEGDYYIRTGEVLQSISVNFSAATKRYKVLFDGRKIKKSRITNRGRSRSDFEENSRMFNAHADFNFDKIPVGQLIEWLEEGHAIPHKEEKREGAHMIRETKQWLQAVIDKLSSMQSNDSFSKSVQKIVKIRY